MVSPSAATRKKYKGIAVACQSCCEDLNPPPNRKELKTAAHENKLTLRTPKSGKEREFVFIPQRVADRLNDYARENGIPLHSRIFPICYEAARALVRKKGNGVGISLRSHDLRRHSVAHPSTTQRYLGKVSDLEAMG
jgi:hypothetical protein